MDENGKLYEWMRVLVESVKTGKDPEKTAIAVETVAEYAKVAVGLWRMLPGGTVDGVKVTRVVVKVAPRSPDKAMLVIQGTRNRKHVVTFHTGKAGAGLFHDFAGRAAAGGLKWREDTPYVEATADETIEPLPGLPGL